MTDPDSYASTWEPYLLQNIQLPPSADLLLLCCRLYAIHFDGYLNAACRQQPYPVSRLEQHRKYPDHDFPHRLFSALYFSPSVCQTIRKVKRRLQPHPSWCYQSLQHYLTYVRSAIAALHSTFSRDAWTLTQPLTVFRGLRLPLHQTPTWHFSGFTSTSYESAYALQMILHGPEPFHTQKHVCYLLEVTLPVQTRFVPLSLLTLQEEHEILVVSQGVLTPQPAVSKSLVFWNPLPGAGPDNRLHYQHVRCTLQITNDQPRLRPFRLQR